jgi:hypothetical protein
MHPLSREIVMTQSDTSQRLTNAALVVMAGASTMLADAALASQGPGGGMGTASHLTQVMMAVAVYGLSGMIVAAGLIGAAYNRVRNRSAAASD